MKQPTSSDRRSFLKAGGAIAAGLISNGVVFAHPATAAFPPLPANINTLAAMPTRNLGKTGYKVGIFSLGGQAALEKPNNFDAAVPIIERALDLGVNYIDTSSIYGGPQRWSEQYVGRVMKTRRQDAFLATKTKERTRDGSLRMIEKSLVLLNTDHIDLWQLHDIGLPEDVNAVFAKGGAMEALLEMQQQKVVRFLGVTGHYRPEALIDAVEPPPLRHHPDVSERRRFAHSQLHRSIAAAGRREADGHHRHEGSRARQTALLMDAASARTAAAFLGGFGDCHAPGRDEYARGHELHSLSPRQHRDHRMRQHCAAGRERADRPRVYAALAIPDGGA